MMMNVKTYPVVYSGWLCVLLALIRISIINSTDPPQRVKRQVKTADNASSGGYRNENVCSSNYTLRPQQERQCENIPHLSCEFGICEIIEQMGLVEVSCLCDKGAVGSECDIKCCLKCEHGKCKVYPDGAEYCKCNVGYYGTLCENERETKTTPRLETTDSPSLDTENQGINACYSNYTMRSLDKRQCNKYLTCLYGRCETEEHEGFLELSCSCDKGSYGERCESKCCLNCLHGKCAIFPNRTEYCKCDYTFTGPQCDYASEPLLMQDTTMASDTANFSMNHSCSVNYTLRPLEQRVCVRDKLTCVYGICMKSIHDDLIHHNCTCDEGAYGLECDKQCCNLNCEHGDCHKLKDSPVYCKCYDGYTGPSCGIPPTVNATTGQKKDTWYLWVVGVCAGVLGLLILALVIIPYWMWHNRVTVIMKIVHYFQPYEDDDERTWDAFVSYKSADVDQNFVLHTLFPKLEKELGFTLCMHFRDFLPGETIANNIINAVNNSRRTILILTPRYIESEFTRFEYQVAQHEMLKRKHRIIPVLLEDISDSMSSMDPNLRQIIKSVTYIEYPGSDATEKKLNTFWKRMALSMPKTRSTEEHQKLLDNNNKTSDNNSVNAISVNGEVSDSNHKRETEMTSFTNGGITPIDNSEINVKIIEETSVASKNLKNNIDSELCNKAFIDD